MARRSPETFMKRQRELRKKEKARRKLERKLQRRQDGGEPIEEQQLYTEDQERPEVLLPPPDPNPWGVENTGS